MDPWRLLYLVPLAAFIAVAGYFLVGLNRDPHTLPSALIDRPVPRFALPALVEGKPGLASADLTGEVALVNVFASWCVPCKVEHPALTRLARTEKVPLYAINYKDKPDDARRWLAELGDPYGRIGADADGRASIEWGVYGVPETFIIDRQGRIRYRHVGPIMPRDLEETILPKLRELGK
jgi:cytochrome c biogenesis protein CcmG/thiol:disulfide interchange protein DsbE